jgi:hypothetical protein
MGINNRIDLGAFSLRNPRVHRRVQELGTTERPSDISHNVLDTCGFAQSRRF